MKKFWKALGIAALAAVVPVRASKDEQTGKKSFQSLLWKLDITPNKDGTNNTEIGLDLMEGVLTAPLMKAVTAKKEAGLFADDEPEAAVVAAEEAQAFADEALTGDGDIQAAEEAPAAAEEILTGDGDVQAADEAPAAEEDAQAAAEAAQAAAAEQARAAAEEAPRLTLNQSFKERGIHL